MVDTRSACPLSPRGDMVPSSGALSWRAVRPARLRAISHQGRFRKLPTSPNWSACFRTQRYQPNSWICSNAIVKLWQAPRRTKFSENSGRQRGGVTYRLKPQRFVRFSEFCTKRCKQRPTSLLRAFGDYKKTDFFVVGHVKGIDSYNKVLGHRVLPLRITMHSDANRASPTKECPPTLRRSLCWRGIASYYLV